MKLPVLISILLFPCAFLNAQQVTPEIEQQVEELAASEDAAEVDAYDQQLERFLSDPLLLNHADENELNELGLLNEFQVRSLIQYRALLGPLIDIHELQAVPGFDIATIKKILPFVSFNGERPVKDLKSRIQNGGHLFLLRVTHPIQSAAKENGFLGSMQRIMFRYRYQYKNLLQFGITGEKDPGESFLKGYQRKGFDFYSLHFFMGKMGIIEALAIGDFTVNMGQGLIHWQNMAFHKSAMVLNIKRQSPVLRPYNSAGEFFFCRGGAVTLRKNKFEGSIFFSSRKLDAKLEMDSLAGKFLVTSIISSGYHRTGTEITNGNKQLQTTAGAVIRYGGRDLSVALNGIWHRYSVPLKREEIPYRQFDIYGSQWGNASISYHYTWKNLHAFGELAVDRNLTPAIVNGLLFSADPAVDLALHFRSIPSRYKAVSGNAFTEGSLPSNESGIYLGTSLRPAHGWRLDAYIDLFKFHWLQYRVDAPAGGLELLVQLNWQPSKGTELYTRFRNEQKQVNGDVHAPLNTPGWRSRKSWRTHLSCKLNRGLSLRQRVELAWWAAEEGEDQQGFLCFTELVYNPPVSRFSGSIRMQCFETTGYDARIYAFENNGRYQYSAPAFSGKGHRYTLNLDFALSKRISVWMRWAETISRELSAFATGPGKTYAVRQSELSMQLILML